MYMYIAAPPSLRFRIAVSQLPVVASSKASVIVILHVF